MHYQLYLETSFLHRFSMTINKIEQIVGQNIHRLLKIGLAKCDAMRVGIHISLCCIHRELIANSDYLGCQFNNVTSGWIVSTFCCLYQFNSRSKMCDLVLKLFDTPRDIFHNNREKKIFKKIVCAFFNCNSRNMNIRAIVKDN